MRIWVTGVGIVSPLAPSSRTTMDKLCAGERAFGPVTLFDTEGQRSTIAAEVADLRLDRIVPAGVDATSFSRTDGIAILAAREALAEARITPANDRTDLVVGTTTGATFETELALPNLLADASAERLTAAIVHPLALTVHRVARVVGPFRRRRLVSSACSTGANALMLAASWLRAGLSERVLAGASDSLCRLTFTGFNALGSLDTEPCRPFDASRRGLGLGEGAAFLVLERDDVARARGAEPIAELVGWAAGAEAHHITNPEATGAVATRAMRQALASANLGPSDVDYVNAHGTATTLNDPMEVHAVRAALGEHFERVSISSVKGQIGHSLGAAGAVEAAITALAIAQKRVPPTGGLHHVADDCQANHVMAEARALDIRVALSNSFGFGGLDGVVALARPGYAPDVPVSTQRTVHVLGGALLAPGSISTLADATWAAQPLTARTGPVEDSALQGLDPARARRLARAERLTAVTLRAVGVPSERSKMGLIVAKPSGNPDATSRFLDRVQKRGPRLASPADFPNLMLSSLAGHVSIYHRLEGPALTTSAQSGSGAACLRTAWELLAAGSSRLFASAVDPWGMAAEVDSEGRAEVAAALLLDARDEGDAVAVWRVFEDTEEIPAPRTNPIVLTCIGANSDWLNGSAWREVRRESVEDRIGKSDATAAAAVVIACASVIQGIRDVVLVLASEEDQTFAVVVQRP